MRPTSDYWKVTSIRQLSQNLVYGLTSDSAIREAYKIPGCENGGFSIRRLYKSELTKETATEEK